MSYLFNNNNLICYLYELKIICPKDLINPPTFDGFGFALGLNGVDLDRNGYPDMAVGAPLSDNVIVFRSRPVIK